MDGAIRADRDVSASFRFTGYSRATGVKTMRRNHRAVISRP
ncbi:hypothetical protein [Morganella psychrotolerans]|nr:hypothetical protein [Morganella psychrotolerans]